MISIWYCWICFFNSGGNSTPSLKTSCWMCLWVCRETLSRLAIGDVACRRRYDRDQRFLTYHSRKPVDHRCPSNYYLSNSATTLRGKFVPSNITQFPGLHLPPDEAIEQAGHFGQGRLALFGAHFMHLCRRQTGQKHFQQAMRSSPDNAYVALSIALKNVLKTLGQGRPD